MNSLLSAKFYQLKRQTSTWVILILAFLTGIFGSLMAALMYGNIPFCRELLSLMITYMKAYNFSGSTDTVISILEYLSQNVLNDKFIFIANAFTSDAVLFVALFVLFNLVRGRKDGFEKQLLSSYSQGQRFFSDVIVLLVYVCVLSLVMTIPYLVMSFIAIQDVLFVNLFQYLCYFALKALLLLLIGSLMIAFLDILPKRKSSYVLVILYVLLLYATLYDFFTAILQNVMNVNLYADFAFPIGSYLNLTYGDSTTSVVSLIVLVLYSALAVIFELIVAKKKDQA